jgi:chromate reductase, NAD(P)H dehydrogenase (quinone)
MAPPRILIFSGSARSQALSKRLARASLVAVDSAGGHGTLIDLADFEMPLYRADLEASHGLPDATRQLQALIAGHEALLIASPEYNGSMTPLLVNTLAWCSRADAHHPSGSGLAIFADKPAAVVGSSPSARGGLRALIHLRDLLGYLGMVVIPQQLAVPRAHQAFDTSDRLIDEGERAGLDAVALALVKAATCWRAAR